MLADEVLRFVEENNVKFIRLAFLDLFGRLKNIAIMPDQLSRAFETGIPLDATAVDGFEAATDGNLLLRPDPATMTILPWRPQADGVCRVLCDIQTVDGKPFVCDARSLLKAAVAEAADMGLSVRIASECEFYLFEANEKGEMTDVPHDRAGYLDVAPLDHSEDVRREICLTLERMNIRPESSHHERGPGQNEVDFHRADPLTAADQLIAFYNAVRTVASRYGLRASFLPKPIDDEAGNGMHVNLSLYRERENLFRLVNGKPGTEAGAAIAGLLNRLCGISLFLNPLPNSFDRLCDEAAPHRLCWSTAQDSSALCIPLPQDRFARIRLQTPDPTCNAYLAFALIIRAALYGIRQGERLEDCKRAGESGILSVVDNMQDAMDAARASAFVKDVLPAPVVDSYLRRAQKLLDQHQRDTTGLFHKLFERY